jgi:hypothetical protein
MDKKLFALLAKIEVGAILIIIASSYLLINFEINLSAVISLDFCKLWLVGILTDVCSFILISICIIARSKSRVAFPMIGWALYFFSCLLCSKSLFLVSRETAVFETIFLKVVEFLLLSLLHLVLQILLPALIEKFIGKSD